MGSVVRLCAAGQHRVDIIIYSLFHTNVGVVKFSTLICFQLMALHSVVHWCVKGHFKSENFLFLDRDLQRLGPTVGYEVYHKNKIVQLMQIIYCGIIFGKIIKQ